MMTCHYSIHNYILKVISISTPDVSKSHTFTPIHFWQPCLLFSDNIFNMSIYNLFCPGDTQASSLAPLLKTFNFLPVTINNFLEFTFLSCYSKKLSISPVKYFYFLRWNGCFLRLLYGKPWMDKLLFQFYQFLSDKCQLDKFDPR